MSVELKNFGLKMDYRPNEPNMLFCLWPQGWTASAKYYCDKTLTEKDFLVRLKTPTEAILALIQTVQSTGIDVRELSERLGVTQAEKEPTL